MTAKDGKLETKLVDVDRDLAVIPSVAIHMNRAANDGFKLMANIDTLPLYGMQEASGSFRSVVAKAAGVQEDEVLGEDLSLYVRTRGTCLGREKRVYSRPAAGRSRLRVWSARGLSGREGLRQRAGLLRVRQ